MPPDFRHFTIAAIVCLLGTAGGSPATPEETGPADPLPAAEDRAALDAQFLEMFARAYYPGRSGRVLDEAVAGLATPPRVVLLAVLDGARRDFFEHHAADLPTFARLRTAGAWFEQAAIDYLPSLTSVGHASIATGAEPRLHGIVANTMFDRRTGRPSGPFPGTAPANLAALTIADLWNLRTRGEAVIIAQGTTPRATVPMAGHGGCLISAEPVVMAMFDAGSGAWVTNDTCYRLPAYVASDTADRVWRDGETWLGHEVSDGRTLLRTGWFATFQTDALIAMIDARPGARELQDARLRRPSLGTGLRGTRQRAARVGCGARPDRPGARDGGRTRGDRGRHRLRPRHAGGA